MGLDCTAYSNLRYLGHCPDRDEEDHGYDPDTYDRTHVEAYAYDAFPHALMGVPNIRTTSGFSGSTFLSGGCYEVTEKTEVFRFRAGSYGGYNHWRRELADQFNPYRRAADGGDLPPTPEGPFYELIWFADNEGTLATMACAKLAIDFQTHAEAYRKRWSDSAVAMEAEYNIQRYEDWTKAFLLAADGGMVDFH
jgi:hypothetical protein